MKKSKPFDLDFNSHLLDVHVRVTDNYLLGTLNTWTLFTSRSSTKRFQFEQNNVRRDPSTGTQRTRNAAALKDHGTTLLI